MAIATASVQLDGILSRICEALQLSDGQYAVAERHYRDVSAWLLAPESQIARFKPHVYPQGSFLIRTTVRPILYEEYDLDFILEMDFDRIKVPPSRALEFLKTRLDENPNYRTETLKRCIRLQFPHFHLDVLPATPDTVQGGSSIRIPDRQLQEWLVSDPKAFAAWFEGRSSLAVLSALAGIEPLPEKEPPEFKTRLRQIVQLWKRWRDVRYRNQREIAPVSIVLTTLAGLSYRPKADLYESFVAVLEVVARQLAAHPKPFAVVNPTNPDEILSEKWFSKEESYQLFRSRLPEFLSIMRTLANGDGIHEVKKILEHLFGMEPVERAMTGHIRGVSDAGREGKLHMFRKTGMLLPAAIPHSVPVPKHTFYGD